MKVLIIDNEENLRSSCKDLLKLLCPNVSEISEAEGVQSGLELINTFHPDIVLLDVEMDDGSGFDLMKLVEDPTFQLIFITAHNKYAIDAFQFSAIDYLLKPVDPSLFKSAIDKAFANMQQHDFKSQIDFLLNQISGMNESDKRIVLKDISNIYYVKVNEILYCEAKGNYTQFYIQGQDSILVSKILKEYAAILEPLGFLRTHNSFLINPHMISKYDKEDGGSLILENGVAVPLSQRKKDSVLAFLESKLNF